MPMIRGNCFSQVLRAFRVLCLSLAFNIWLGNSCTGDEKEEKRIATAKEFVVAQVGYALPSAELVPHWRNPITSMRLLPDGKTVVAYLQDAAAINVYHVDREEEIGSIVLPPKTKYLGVSADGNWLLVKNADELWQLVDIRKIIANYSKLKRNRVEIWDGPKFIPPGQKRVAMFRVSDDGQFMLTQNEHDYDQWRRNCVRMWSTATGKQLWQIAGKNFSNGEVATESEVIDCELIAPRNNFQEVVVWLADSGLVSVVDGATGERKFDVPIEETPDIYNPYSRERFEAQSFRLHPDQRHVVGPTESGSWIVVDLEQKKVRRQKGRPAELYSFAFSPDGKRLVTDQFSDEALIELFEWPSLKLLSSAKHMYDDFDDLRFVDEKTIRGVEYSNVFTFDESSKAVKSFALWKRPEIDTDEVTDAMLDEAVEYFQFARDQRLITVSKSRTLRIRMGGVISGMDRVECKLPGFRKVINSDSCEQSNYVAVLCRGKEPADDDSEEKSVLRLMHIDRPDEWSEVAVQSDAKYVLFSSDGQTLYSMTEETISQSSDIWVIDIDEQAVTRKLPVPLTPSTYWTDKTLGDTVFGPGGKISWVPATGRRMLLNPKTHRFEESGIVLRTPGDETRLHRNDFLAFQQKSKKLVAIDTLTGEERGELLGYDNNWLSYRIRNDGRYLVAKDHNTNQMSVVDSLSGLKIAEFDAAPENHLSISPDGKTLGTLGNGLLRLWDLDAIIERFAFRPEKRLSDAEFSDAWKELHVSCKSIDQLVRHADQTLDYAEENLHTTAKFPADRATKLISQLSSQDVVVRKAAAEKLRQLDARIAKLLDKNLAERRVVDSATDETARLSRDIALSATSTTNRSEHFAARSIELLYWLTTAPSISDNQNQLDRIESLLQRLASGDAEATLTKYAAFLLKKLSAR